MTEEIRDQRPRIIWIYDTLIRGDGKGLGPTAIAVYCALACYADNAGKSFPAVATIGKTLGISENTVRDALRALETKKWIAIEKRGAKGLPNLYTILAAVGVQELNPPPSNSEPEVTTTLNSEKPTVTMLFMENIHGYIKHLEIERLQDGEAEYGYDIMRAAIKEAAGSKTPMEKKSISVNYVITIAARLFKEGLKSMGSNGNGQKQAAPREDDPRRFKEFKIG